ncbi:hypothetical protein BCR44DRAFT_40998, partial [Catenaria anguillulae PL171]
MDALLRAALALPDCPIPTTTTLASSAPTAAATAKPKAAKSNGHVPIPPPHQHQHYQLPDKHILAARLRAQLGRAAQRANLKPPLSKQHSTHHHLRLHHPAPGHNHNLTNLHDIPSLPSTPTPTSSCADHDTDTDLDAFTATWTLAREPLSPPASIARFSCAPTHLIPQVTLPLAAHLGPHGEPMAAVSHHLASECRSVASIHVVTSNGHHGSRANGGRRYSFVYYDDRDSEDDVEEDEASDDEWATPAATTTAITGAAASSSSSRGAHVPPAAYAEMEEAAWTILRMMQDSQVLPSEQPPELAEYPSSSSSPSTPSSPREPDAMDVDPPPTQESLNTLPTDGVDDDSKEVEGDSTIELDTPTKPDPPVSSSPPSSTLTHRLALTRRRVQSELAHRRPAALTLTPNGLGARRGSLSSAGSSPGPKSATSATPGSRIPFPMTPTSAAGTRPRRRSLSASEHLIMGQLARSPLALAFSKQQQAAAAVAEATEPASSPDRTSSAATTTSAAARRPLLTSASVPGRRSTTASPSPASSSSSSRIPRELANLADFLKPPPEAASDGSAAKMAASPLSASLLASGAPVDMVVASVVGSTESAGVGTRRAAAAAARLGTIDEKESVGVVKGELREPVAAAVGVATRKRMRRGAAAAAVASDVDEDHGDEEEEQQAPSRKRQRKVPSPPLVNGRTRAAAASVSANGSGRRGRAAAVKPAAPTAVGRVTRGRAAGRAVITEEPQEEDDESLSDAEEASGGEDHMDETASLSSVPSSP